VRVLVVAAPLLGHVLPLVPFATALRTAGHEVLVAAGDVAGHVGGLPAHDLAPGFRLDRHAVRVLATHPLVARRELQGRAGTRGVGLLFGAVNAGLLGPVEELVAQWRPDLVVHEPLACADAIVHHGGAGTVLAALASGVPQLVIPGPGDRRHNGELVARRGAGLTGAPARSTITRLLADDGLHSAAAEVRAEIAAMPDPADVATAVLAGTR
jgi:UDP:flavonoid glycosyltransferase YjiC (YdhE family)